NGGSNREGLWLLEPRTRSPPVLLLYWIEHSVRKKNRFCRRIIQIVDRPLQCFRIVPQMTQNIPDTASAQEPSDALPTRLGTRAARVVVVDRELPARAVRPAANVTPATLGLVDRPVLLIRDVVGLFDVCLVRVSSEERRV